MTQERVAAQLRSETGAIAIMAALTLTVMLGFAALAVDVGTLYAQKRALQSATDAAAMAATFPLAADPTASITSASALAIAQQSMASNQIITTTLTATPGVYCADSTIASSARFTSPSLPYQCPNATDPTAQNNAVKVTSVMQSPYYFARVLTTASGQGIGATATATKIDEAGFMAGTGLLSIDTTQSPVFNALFSALLPGSTIQLNAVDYNGLLSTNVQAMDFFNALATRLSITGGTYGTLLSSSVSIGTVLQAAVDALNSEGNVAGAQAGIAALTNFSSQITGQRMITLGQLFDLGVWQNSQIQPSAGPAALQAGLNLFQLATASAQMANGQRSVDVGSMINLAPLATVTATLGLSQPLQPFAFGPIGASVHTSQVQLTLGLSLLGGLVKIPLYVEVAQGDATLAGITCGASPKTDATFTVMARAGLVSTTLASVPLAGIGAGAYQAMTFTQADVANHAFQRANGNLLSLSLNSSLSLGNLGLLVGLLQQPLVANILGPLAASLNASLQQILNALGIQVGYIDVYPTGMRCGVPALIQ